jgi:hypothetical protein
VAAAVLLPCRLASPAPKPRTTLGIQGARFTLNGKPTFLLGISYYAGLGASDATVRADLREAKRLGVNWLREWATWAGFGNDVSAVDAEGKPRQPYLDRLRALVARCDGMGMAVDVTLSRGNGERDSPNLLTLPAHRRAVRTLIEALKPYRNWYLDLANERNIGDARHASTQDLAILREDARRLAPWLLVTASQGGDIPPDDLREYLLESKVDFVTPHRPREAGSAAQTERVTRKLMAEMGKLGRVVPIHYQEPFRRGYADWQPSEEDYLTDLRGAMAGGAAGWCFHNGNQRDTPGERPRRSFDLRDRPLFQQLDPVELRALKGLKGLRGLRGLKG